MRLRQYLTRTSQSDAAFAVRAGLPRSTVNTIAAGGAASIETAVRIIDATDGAVSLLDLIAEKSHKRTG